MKQEDKNSWIVILTILLLCSLTINIVRGHTINNYHDLCSKMTEDIDKNIDKYNNSLTTWKNIATDCVYSMNETYIDYVKSLNESCEICLSEMREAYMLGAVMGVDWYDEFADNIVCK